MMTRLIRRVQILSAGNAASNLLINTNSLTAAGYRQL
jgi:hypothetical protein